VPSSSCRAWRRGTRTIHRRSRSRTATRSCASWAVPDS
jgi:hypothetical protein